MAVRLLGMVMKEMLAWCLHLKRVTQGETPPSPTIAVDKLCVDVFLEALV